MKPKLTYANVMATTAVFIALGGAAYAGTRLPKNSVGTKQLKAKAVTAAKIKDGTITGAKINLSTLGTVPSASRAEQAGRSDLASNSNLLGGSPPSAFHDRCPSGTTPAAGDVCVTSSIVGTFKWAPAVAACAALGLRLPDPSEAALIAPQATETYTYWTDDFWMEPTNTEQALYFYKAESHLTEGFAMIALPTYCVTSPANS